jgi:hypothetical protein
MRKVGAGLVIVLALVGLGAVIWLSLDEQAKGVLVGIVVGGVGAFVGFVVALAVVAIFLLYNLRWQVQGRQLPPPMVHGSQQGLPALPPGRPEYHYYPPPQPTWARSPRDWQILGEDDMPHPP